MKHIKRLFETDPWRLVTKKCTIEDKRLQESLTSIGNGYMGMRGNFEESYSGDTHQGIYLAGVWYPDKTKVGWWKNGYPDYFGKVINATNFIAVDILVNGELLDLAKQASENFKLALDMRNGVLSRQFTAVVGGVELSFSFERFLSLTTKELSAQKVEVTSLSGAAKVELISKLDGNVHNLDTNYDEKFWITQAVGEAPIPYLTTQTIPNDFGIEQFTVTTAMENKTFPQVKGEFIAGESIVSEHFVFDLNAGEAAQLEKKVVVLTSRDIAEEAQLAKADEIISALEKESYVQLKEATSQKWQERWQIADVVISGDDAAQQGIRYNLFQLFSTYYGEDERLNIGPKGFTGEKYGGATYWDTEAYAVPLYLALADKSVTRNLLKYRYNQLPQAKHNARQQGLLGALYPMVTFTGVECHNEWEITFEEIHRN
ncbi:MAG: glycoside hydrolase family 65 protein, partial [Streptococcaceae bacterium]|nr:glycoside hydrolase family 65 protein [Streptococcaceae bacterium]